MMKNYHQGPIVTEGLVLAMDAGNLVSYESGSSSVNSLVGVVEGSLINGVGYDKAYGGSWVFDGTDDYISTSTFNMGTPPNITVDFWVKVDVLDSSDRKVLHFDKTGTTNAVFQVRKGSTNSNLMYQVHDGNTWTTMTDSTAIVAGEWAHFTVTQEGNNAKFYKNGVLTTTSTMGTLNWTNANNLLIGSRGGGEIWDGNISLVRLYNAALTAEEVLQNYNALRNRFVNVAPNPIETDGEWLKVFRQDSSTGEFFSSTNNWAEARTTNSDNPQANKYSILNTVENYKLNDRYTFKINYPNEGITNIWSQTNNPVNDDGTQGVSGYIGIDIQTTANGWNGLEQYAAQTSTFLDGTLDPRSNWYYAIGSRPWSGATTFPGWDPPVEVVELWVKYK